MAEITAKMVAELREMTGLGMMDCKKALVEADGDLKAAEEALRIKSGNKASKVAGRTAAEGTVAAFVQGNIGALAEVNCETDFVGKDAGFLAFAQAAAEAIVAGNPADVEALGAVKTASGETVEELRKAIIAKLGENINVRRFVRFETQGQLATYLHGSKIGVVVDMTGGDAVLGKDIAMHIAACKPKSLDASGVDAELIATERRVAIERAKEAGKPEAMLEKIAEGTVQKFLKDVTLLSQPFVKDDKLSVEQLLKANNASVTAFTMYVVGEGIEKKVVDFAAEVAAAAKV
ncbi:translation elongation factor Ts [Chitinimonas viridis]|uniref:Elongation factor Ts n=2 Tax=Chitinimonas TaxID=240411 RepID=A0ABT8B1B0_9NEIS|nr:MULTISPECIES: translation elongation factor Ts [Chitinimonas]MBL8509281.1 elongation factor Ts [Chitinimonas sp.]MDN3576008.1 translation elongation factor Ts [Chitinimonas viridis]GLR14295.1 elongation factor Ts [Chitinimonas prasina]